MKKLFFTVLSIFLVSTLTSCGDETVDELNLDFHMNDYILVKNQDVIRFEFQETIEINQTYSIISIEELTTGFGEYPYESVFLDESKFNDFSIIILELSDALNDLELDDQIFSDLEFKPKYTITLTSGISDIVFRFYQDLDGNISKLRIDYNDNENREIMVYINEHLDTVYEMLSN